eukprot:TRINITY_DN8497_c0_g1_i1.p1 TRINITY_DN8497_c0_g1~~TRINITY_DN8497_c0_g1_i1.p1  ORF type:complete len:269 (-),score=39.71 TRINITY_DN8497_c0_g1_i1:29-835(-)
MTVPLPTQPTTPPHPIRQVIERNPDHPVTTRNLAQNQHTPNYTYPQRQPLQHTTHQNHQNQHHQTTRNPQQQQQEIITRTNQNTIQTRLFPSPARHQTTTDHSPPHHHPSYLQDDTYHVLQNNQPIFPLDHIIQDLIVLQDQQIPPTPLTPLPPSPPSSSSIPPSSNTTNATNVQQQSLFPRPELAHDHYYNSSLYDIRREPDNQCVEITSKFCGKCLARIPPPPSVRIFKFVGHWLDEQSTRHILYRYFCSDCLRHPGRSIEYDIPF